MNLDWLISGWNLIVAHKEWLFSGIGLMIFTILGYFFFVRPMNRKMSRQLEDITDNIKNQGDTTSPQTSINGSTINGPVHTGQGDKDKIGDRPRFPWFDSSLLFLLD